MVCIKNSARILAEKASGWKVIHKPEFYNFLVYEIIKLP